MSHSSILLRGGTVLFHQEDDHVKPLHSTDILIEGNTIKEIGAGLSVHAETKIIDCKDKIISPGFVDTHHHLWQTQLKGRHADQTLLEYFPTGMIAHHSYDANDMYWGQLGGCLEALDAGTTFVVDHYHGTVTPDHAAQALAATVDSGLRSIFCYCYILRIAEWDKTKFVPDQNLIADWATQQLDELFSKQPFGPDKTVHIGFGFDLFFLPKEVVTGIFDRVRKAGAKLITTHSGRSPVYRQHSSIELMKEYGILGPDILFSHANNLAEHEYQILKDAGCFISTTPHSETQMAMGWPVAFSEQAGIANSCLGVDCSSIDSSYMPDQMKLLLQVARQRTNQTLLEQGKYPKKLIGTVEEVFNLGTIHGARAVRMEDKIGSITVGKLADLVVFDTKSPSIACSPGIDPVVAVVRHSTVRDVETVIVGGKVVKEEGKLVDVKTKADGVEKSLAWEQVVEKLGESQARIFERLDKLDNNLGLGFFMHNVDEKAMV